MIKEKERLINMLKANKISEDDYKLLSAAIDKKPSSVSLAFSLLTNPFQKVAGLYALITGLVVILCMTYFGVLAQCYSIGIVGALNASVIKNPNIQPTFFLLLYQNLVVWIVMTLLFIGLAKILQQKRLRLVDFFGTVALARFPYLIMMIILAITRLTHQSFLDIDLSKGLQLHPTILMSVFSAVIIACFIWEVVMYFYALKESSGLRGKKLMLSFIAALILGELITSPLTTLFF